MRGMHSGASQVTEVTREVRRPAGEEGDRSNLVTRYTRSVPVYLQFMFIV